MTTPETGIVISLPEIYAEVRNLGKTLGRVENTLTTHVADCVERDRRRDTQFDDHEIRIRADEANRWPRANVVALATVTGAGAALAALFVAR